MIHLLKITSSLAISASLMLTSIQIPYEPDNRVSLEHNGFTATYLTKQETVADFLKERGITLHSDDQINLSLAQELEKSETIVIKSPRTVTVRADGEVHTAKVYEGTVGSVLDSLGIKLGDQDWINADPADPVTDRMVLNIQRVQIQETVRTRTIEHSENTALSSELLKGKEKVVQPGVDGERTIVTRRVLVDGEAFSEEVVSNYVTAIPLARTTLVGTKKPVVKKPEPAKVVRAETKAPVKKAVKPAPKKTSTSTTVKKTTTLSSDSDKNWKTFTLTFYTNLPSENGGYTITASGKSLKFGMVASNYYPLGKKIYLTGYGTMTVEDRGGSNFNNSYRLDVFIPRKSGESNTTYLRRVNNLGVRKVKGYVK